MSSDALYPLTFDVPSPPAGAAEYLEDPSVRLLVAFFRNKGLEALKREDRQEDWYQDWIDYQAEHGLYAGLLSPERYSSLGHRLNLLRLLRFLTGSAPLTRPPFGHVLHRHGWRPRRQQHHRREEGTSSQRSPCSSLEPSAPDAANSPTIFAPGAGPTTNMSTRRGAMMTLLR